ncbi:Scr1 family TA system antitoxin-like transcriptional regulator [Kitasatospora brasiliensis]|uniref:Scr1 family TA system antitoxin-like transcriptional regulator n=1 Tax=Kitasatospora brasiliensis TaxID=3058040 RepID=UPI00292E4F0C|nr:Scr1 family TA system antitoxin-like transcriptional regulator [Kitasatospora sp. K002]
MLGSSNAVSALRALAAHRLDVPFDADGVPQLSWRGALDRIAAELSRTGVPQLENPSAEHLAEALEDVARRLRRGSGGESGPALLDMMASELLDADAALRKGEYPVALDLARRVCAVIVCLDEIATHTAAPSAGPALPGAGQAHLRVVEHRVPSIPTTSPPAPQTSARLPELPWRGGTLVDVVLGSHLRHLRECQGLARADVTARLPACLQGIDVDALEAGSSPVLREAAAGGRLADVLHAYGTGAIAATDFEHCVAANTRTRHGYFIDRGPGRAHRYQLLEHQASSMLLAGSLLVPAAVRVPAYEQAVARKEASRVRVADNAAPRAAAPVSDRSCALCQAYRADLLHGPQAATAWLRQVGAVRAEAFEGRLRAPDAPPTTVLLDSDLLRRPDDEPGVHAAQMLHLAHLARTTALRVRVLPPAAGAVLTADTAELAFRDGRIVTAVWGLVDITYQHGDDLRPHIALDRALPPAESVRLLERAAAGDLPRRARW